MILLARGRSLVREFIIENAVGMRNRTFVRFSDTVIQFNSDTYIDRNKQTKL